MLRLQISYFRKFLLHQLFLLFEKITIHLIDIDCGHFDIKTP